MGNRQARLEPWKCGGCKQQLQLLITDKNGNVRSHDDVQRLTDTTVSLSQGERVLLGTPNTLLGRDYGMQSNFWKFYLIRTSFIFGEPEFLVKVFRLFRLEWIFLVFRV